MLRSRRFGDLGSPAGHRKEHERHTNDDGRRNGRGRDVVGTKFVELSDSRLGLDGSRTIQLFRSLSRELLPICIDQVGRP